jgi:hypothetical protein
VTGDQQVAVLAHGLGGSTDLPIPFADALIGAACALAFTFAVLAFAWREPRFDPSKPGRPLPGWVTHVVDSPITRWVVAIVALLFTAWVVMAAMFGPQNDKNALQGVFYILLWVGLVPASLLVGPVWRSVSPIRTLYRIVPRRLMFRPGPYPEGWGYWPAVVGLFAFVRLELASPDPGALAAVELWLLTYAVSMFLGGLMCGDRWFIRADPFEVYSVAVSRLSLFRRNRETRRIVVGNPFDHLPSLPVRPGTVAVLAVLLGSTAFDSFSATPKWRNFADALAQDAPLVPEPVAASFVRTGGLLVFILVVGVTFALAARVTGGVGRGERRALPGLMAHSLIPIVVGYIFAHYLSFLVERGQQTVIRLANALPRGWDLLGLGDADVAYVLSSHPPVLATIKVSCVVAGHIAGVIAAHDRALRLLPQGHQLTGQLAMMLTMVGYTFTGLYLLFGG